MAKFNEYTVKATPEDADTLMLYDAASKANKLSPFSGIWNWIVGKLTNAVISNLQTNNKTVLEAINELNSNSLSRKTESITQLPDGNKAKLISTGSTDIDVGSTGEKIPSWSFGIFLPSNGGSDACLLCVNSTQITIAYKSSNVWISCKRIG